MRVVSKHISYAEAIRSQTATRRSIDNTPTDQELLCMQTVANRVFEPVREFFGFPIYISSFFRSVALNKRIGGSSKSQHCLGQAIDMDADVFGHITNKQIFDYIKDNLPFSKLIWEFGNKSNPAWVHVSYVEGDNSKIVLRAIKNMEGKTEYHQY